VAEFTKKNNFTVTSFKNKRYFRECIHEQKNLVALAFKIKIISHSSVQEQSNVEVAPSIDITMCPGYGYGHNNLVVRPFTNKIMLSWHHL
jgi:hypothetical protein